MAITTVIGAITDAVVPGTGSDFTTTSRGFWFHGDDFGPGECAWLQREGPSGNFKNITNNEGVITVGQNPNMVYVDAPAGTYYIGKTSTNAAASVGIEQSA